ncbi:hypothetical protein T310_1632 [Rasamsonia emersonii CBS 393.64]|uniref:Uncharacterized protein n=1 Tax=Rasamsonia emersonii (strain ATCC 16479 / CBS 393.64 / IMI 116815) TaxID=1408163 RepID=A0A0F4Z1E8_RASE3|nr:hypothetical protein T310_1632 [Rasamsonia emersonii CBS 393.64]KKA24347.1 hypothetical protein T310_1632 [Rasamsonia emersonii CBS 393.64]
MIRLVVGTALSHMCVPVNRGKKKKQKEKENQSIGSICYLHSDQPELLNSYRLHNMSSVLHRVQSTLHHECNVIIPGMVTDDGFGDDDDDDDDDDDHIKRSTWTRMDQQASGPSAVVMVDYDNIHELRQQSTLYGVLRTTIRCLQSVDMPINNSWIAGFSILWDLKKKKKKLGLRLK